MPYITSIIAILLLTIANITSVNAENNTSITFLHVNDIYEISPNRDGIGGFSQLSSMIKHERGKNKNTIVTFGGDLLSPSLLSGMTDGKHMIKFMNAIGTDFAVPGNHEFDFGADIFTKRLNESNFPWLAANLSGSDAVIADKLITIDGYKIGIFGLITPDTPDLSSSGEKIKFSGLVDTARLEVEKLQQAGADVIVALTHNDYADDLLLMKVKGINLILGGHDHDPLTLYDGRVLLHKSGSDAQYLGVVTLTIETKKGRKGDYIDVTPSWNMRLVKNIAKDAAVEKMVAGYEFMLDEKLGHVVAKLESLLDSRKAVIRVEETSMGNFISDALRYGVNADIALSNGGGIRGNRQYEAGHELTRKDILSELPFGNVTVLLELSGNDIVSVLEHSLSKIEDKAGRFLQVSGLEFSYDPKAAVGKRIIEILIAGKPINKQKIYKIATNDYIANGGDGFKMLKSAKRLIDASGATLMATMVMDYAEKIKIIDSKIEGRIKVK